MTNEIKKGMPVEQGQNPHLKCSHTSGECVKMNVQGLFEM